MGFFMYIIIALSQLLWRSDGNVETCFEDEVYWFNGHFTQGIGWERECIPLDDV